MQWIAADKIKDLPISIPDNTKMLALLVGSTSGENEHAACIEKDLHKMQNATESIFPGATCTFVCNPDDNITVGQYEHYLKQIVTQAHEHHSVGYILIYFTGHGKQKKDGCVLQLRHQEIYIQKILTLFATLELADTKKLFVFDVCSSSPGKTSTAVWKNFYILNAASEGQRACAMVDVGSVFTDVLASTILERKPDEDLIFSDVINKVEQIVRELKLQPQIPRVQVTNGENDFAPGYCVLSSGMYACMHV